MRYTRYRQQTTDIKEEDKYPQPFGYTFIPKWAWWDKQLPDGVKIFYINLLMCSSNKSFKCNYKNITFQNWFSVSPATVKNWIKILVDMGYIKISYIGKDRTITLLSVE